MNLDRTKLDQNFGPKMFVIRSDSGPYWILIFLIFVNFHDWNLKNPKIISILLWMRHLKCFKVENLVSSIFAIIWASGKLFKYIKVFLIINDREWSDLIPWRNFKMFNFWWLNLRWRGLRKTYRLLLMMHFNESSGFYGISNHSNINNHLIFLTKTISILWKTRLFKHEIAYCCEINLLIY